MLSQTLGKYLEAALYSTRTMRTVQLGPTVFQEQFKVECALLMAAVVFVTLPSLLLFFLGQKQFVKGIATAGLK